MDFYSFLNEPPDTPEEPVKESEKKSCIIQ